MSASARILDQFSKSNGSDPIRILGASGQLGYGIPTSAFSAGLDRQPHLIGCDMGSIDIGPYYLGSGEMATATASTKRDLKKVLLGALKHKIPLVIGSAGSAGAKPHLDKTLALIGEIARDNGLRFRMAVLHADVDKNVLKVALKTNGVTPIDDMLGLNDEEIDAAANIVGQMGMSAFQRALAEGIDVVIAGRACDTAIFAALPAMTGFPVGPAMHMAKIIECASLCCVPGGRDAILATLDHEGFELDSMAPQRCATPVSVAAHSLYEQIDPFTVYEPEGRLDLARATYHAIDNRRTRVVGALWEDAKEPWVKIEGSRKVGERAVLLCGTADPKFIAQLNELLKEVEIVVRESRSDPPIDSTFTILCGRRIWPGCSRWKLKRSSGASWVGSVCPNGQ
jgi:Acyclic terpene utilisation family protein AtuA